MLATQMKDAYLERIIPIIATKPHAGNIILHIIQANMLHTLSIYYSLRGTNAIMSAQRI